MGLKLKIKIYDPGNKYPNLIILIALSIFLPPFAAIRNCIR